MSEMATIQTSLTMSCGVKAFFERRTARTPRSCFDSALVEELIIDDEGSHVICRADSVRPKHLSDRTFDHDYFFELPVRERDAQSSGR